MKTRLVIFLISFLSVAKVFAQEPLDSVFTNTDVFAVHIKEVSDESIKFNYPGEDVVNTIKIESVNRIVFRSGRVQTFTEAPSYRQVVDGLDWEYVSVIQTEGQLSGLYLLDDVSAKAKATTGFGSVGKMENRAMMKLKIETAMNGGNVVYITQQNSSSRSQVSNSSSVVSGVAYSNKIPDYNSFSTFLNKKSDFKLIEKHELGVNSTDISVKILPGEIIKFDKAEQSGNLIYVYANIQKEENQRFRVSYFDNEKIILVYRDKKHIYNLVFSI
jgi:hypothetical protein